jgi:hypothetical protein
MDEVVMRISTEKAIGVCSTLLAFGVHILATFF